MPGRQAGKQRQRNCTAAVAWAEPPLRSRQQDASHACRMPLWVDKLKVNLGLAEEEVQEQTLLQQLDAATTLDRTQRAIGFATCVGIGLLLTFMVRPSLTWGAAASRQRPA